jgi:hypothetical protein
MGDLVDGRIVVGLIDGGIVDTKGAMLGSKVGDLESR